ncbi:tetratricopeptide repeat protein [Tenacibaculum sp. IB213877]|uniref:tetratricopeptide repeat-containing sensor histidine kinase n=1 Tax=Tenacibaculum sp. IB213877 TaxID=3097351 RepID=UPI002A5A3738|nr:tetratricopeptide repeat protein [Tenacibaculum sp. IB213877]MDY0780963.1 tetratricopeptide repeat protein [Tenacibaculum sp. IB213877]
MKKLRISFLFLFSLFSGFNFCWSQAEKPNDSLRYYYDLFYRTEEKSEIILAYKYYDKHKEWSLKNNDTITAIQDLRFITIIQKKLGAYNNAEASAVEALRLLDLLNTTNTTKEARIGLYNDLGIIYRNARNYNKALEYYEKSLALTEAPKHKNILLNNIGYIYKEQKEYKKAFNFFTEVYQKSLKSNDKKQIARALSNLGYVKAKLNYEDAYNNLLEALEIRKKQEYLPGIIASYLHLSEYHKDRNQKQKALLYANKVLAIGKEKQNISYQLDALSLIIEMENNSKILEYKKITDSISMASQLNENKFASMKYDFSEEKRKAEEAKRMLAESKLEKEKQKRLKFIYLAVGVFILLTSIFSYYILKSRHKKEKLQQIYITETRISKKVHDEVANDVYHVMTKLQTNANINEEVLDDLEEIYTKTRDISRENSAMNVGKNFNELLKDLLLSYKDNNVNVITRNISKVNWNKVSNEKKTAIYRVLQELMTNMKKHSKASIVLLNFNQTNNKLTIEYNDNGIGCIVKKLNGLFNVENRINSVNGTITFDSEPKKGFKAKIII